MLTRARWPVYVIILLTGVGAINWIIASSYLHLLLATVVFVAIVVFIEFYRRTSRRDIPWWIAHSMTLPWALIVLVPWIFFAQEGSWRVLNVELGFHLRHTWILHVVVLLALAIGTWIGLVPRLKASKRQPQDADWTRVLIVVCFALAAIALSYVIAGRPFSAAWRLGGGIRYFDNPDQRTALRFLDTIPITAASIALLVAQGARRRTRSRPSRVELGCLAVLSGLTLGSGGRSQLYLLVLGWVAIQVGPSFRPRGRVTMVFLRRMFIGFCGVLALVLLLASAARISDVRARGAGLSEGSWFQRAVRELDVVGSGELLFSSGASPGMLRGESYRELPVLVLPRRVVGETKPNPAADEVVRKFLNKYAGLSAPWWVESYLNYGLGGAALFSFGFSFLFVTALRRARRGMTRSGGVAPLVGPVWIIVSYLVLSRLTTYQLLLTMGSVWAGIYLGGNCLRSQASAQMAGLIGSPLAHPDASESSQGTPIYR